MFTKEQTINKTTYMEIYSQNKISYKIITEHTSNTITFGIEITDCKSNKTEMISNFSKNIEDAIAFVEILIKNNIPPKYVYIKALNYLCKTI